MTPLARALVGPLLVHLGAAMLLHARVLPTLEARLDQLGPIRRGFGALIAWLAYLPASVPAALAVLSATQLHDDAKARRWWMTGIWLLAADTVARAADAWRQPLPTVLGEVVVRVAMSPDAIGRWLEPLAPAAARARGPVGALGALQIASAISFGIAVALARHGLASADPLPQPAARGAVAGLAAATVLAVAVRVASDPAVSAWMQVLG